MMLHCKTSLMAAFVLLLTQALVAAQTPAGSSWAYLPELLHPFWKGDTVYGESVLFIKDAATDVASAKLLFPLAQVLSVRNSAGTITYEEGRDYQWKRGTREIRLPAGSRIVSCTPAELRRPANSQKFRLTHRDGNGEILFGAKLEYHAMQTCITYRHTLAKWGSHVPRFDPHALPQTIQTLHAGHDLSIVVLGDSISTGCNASGWAGAAPFQPAYPELLRQYLQTCYHAKVELTNLSVGGTTSHWGTTMIDKVVAAKPDLVVLAFGMNDATGVPAKEYQANIKTISSKIRQQRPDCEFILIATMLGNPNWTYLHQNLFIEYRDALAELCEPGVALADLTSIWTEILRRKPYRDLTGNGVNHPNDFGHRIYAQVLAELLHAPL